MGKKKQQRQRQRQQQEEAEECGVQPLDAAMSLSVEWPGQELSREWVIGFGEALSKALSLPAEQMRFVVPVRTADSLVASASKLMHKEANCLRLQPHGCTQVVLVGDLHGQFQDLMHLFQLAGLPGEQVMFIFNGDYVDRGAWGLETYLLLLAWKVLLPHRVFLLRGNHETKYCTSVYGFEAEVLVKYGPDGKHVYRKLLGCFEGHPLAAVIAENVFMAHGGLFRSSELGSSRKESRRKADVLKLGTLEDLSRTRRGVLDPAAAGANVVTGDVLWSDPALEPGLSCNNGRGIGLLFGPDCTQEFLQIHGLKLIVRSHEGPDARQKRAEMESMSNGYTIDHVVPAGKLITLFSAPDYPQFQATKTRYNNKGAYIVLEPPDFCEPNISSFEAILPRPTVAPYYDHENVADSDDELALD